MNRLISIGLSVAVAPAILLPISHWTGWPYATHAIDLSGAALLGLVLGGPLIVAWLLGASIKPTRKAINQVEQTHSKAIEETRSRILKVARSREVWRWTIPVVLSLAFFSTYFKMIADHPNEQVFQSGLHALWMLVAVVFLRVVIALFTWQSFPAFVVKLLLLAALLYPLYFLTALTAYVSWRGPEKRTQLAPARYGLHFSAQVDHLHGLHHKRATVYVNVWATLRLRNGRMFAVKKIANETICEHGLQPIDPNSGESPNYRWNGRAASVVLFSNIVLARRSPRR